MTDKRAGTSKRRGRTGSRGRATTGASRSRVVSRRGVSTSTRQTAPIGKTKGAKGGRSCAPTRGDRSASRGIVHMGASRLSGAARTSPDNTTAGIATTGTTREASKRRSTTDGMAPNGTMYDFSIDTIPERREEQRHPKVARDFSTHVWHHDGDPYPSRCYWCRRGRLALTR